MNAKWQSQKLISTMYIVMGLLVPVMAWYSSEAAIAVMGGLMCYNCVNDMSCCGVMRAKAKAGHSENLDDTSYTEINQIR